MALGGMYLSFGYNIVVVWTSIGGHSFRHEPVAMLI